MIQTIEIALLGNFSVTADGKLLQDSASEISEPWQLFCYLVLHREESLTAQQLAERLWPREQLGAAGAQQAVQGAVSLLRGRFEALSGSGASPILLEGEEYRCHPSIRYVVDAEEFDRLFAEAKLAAGGEKEGLLAKAAELYGGDFLPGLEREEWVKPLVQHYRRQYAEVVAALCALYEEEGRFTEMLATSTAASHADPTEEVFYLYLFRALFSLDMHRVILPTYRRVARVFQDELGQPVSPEIREIFRASSERVDTIEQDLMFIKDDLREEVQGSYEQDGPLYCSYEVFKYLYQMVARSSERSGRKVLIVLLSLQTLDGDPLSSGKLLSASMNQLKNLVLGSALRRSDTVARYSQNQFIIMLSVDKPSGVEIVTRRIEDRGRELLEEKGIKLSFATAELEMT